MDFCTLTDIIKSNLVPAEDHKRAIACYRRVCAINKPLNTTVHIEFDVHVYVYEVHSDQSVRCVQTLDSRKYRELRVNMSSIPQQLFGNASHPPANRSESRVARQQGQLLRELYPDATIPALNTYGPLSCNACGHINPKMKKCSRCNCARYCSAQCQRSDWVLHKVSCQAPG